MGEQRKAVALISGGLDSLLAARVIQAQGIHVEGINFFTGFCVEGHTHAIRKRDQKKEKRNNALHVAEQLGIKLHIVDIVEEYKQVLTHPKHGYGANLNPCLDCKIFMVRKAHEWVRAKGFDFIITGEVVGQRPMSQRKETLPIVSGESGANDLLLRPLCAKHLPLTLPEREGWVDRERLYDFSGRSRKPQMALAAAFGIEDYAQPAGGCCFLTDEQYAVKLTDLWRARGSKQYEMDDIMLLKVGRHLRPASRFKVIIAREEGEGRFMQGYRKQYPHLETVSHGGPFALIDGDVDEADVELVARLVARYSQGRNADQVEMAFTDLAGQTRSLRVRPMQPGEIPREWLI
ncbi:MAG: tRNA (5-methylaminomethyl-2-thiouridylate)-methyltransferase [Candidatus Thiodiazotropha sp. (ex Dulcina madagascariensis)]|nr:tRNA (5-methylaminomethyl-2-thiouridylate)-methyltransferase [Candidatus Thiodiazotropha sp. (ex Epidulcina cf. delphinae)]MCU7921299.1 tRNA (5-methylaminomethyl-2-thiouridylate)-methyltransferase [Candidatus Thiodiazotropha sp. (ex Dulcina madagascariensis)]MCU7925705.1 tRNA (5-methylaminomethyl-2-thiouridylate)-methyltransferase [Candidatus Thiodiazotropha sp. (ex Dulcina madagascariensis)]